MNSPPLLIGITGRARSGKDTLGAMLHKSLLTGVDNRVAADCYALASPIKDIISDLMKWDERHRDGYLKEVPVVCMGLTREEFFATLHHHLSDLSEYEAVDIAGRFSEIIFTEGRESDDEDGTYIISPRQVYQEFGTEVCRSVRDTIWLDQAIAKHNAGQSLIVTDVRFANEAAYIRAHGLLIHVQRDNAVAVAGHASEAGITFESGDVQINNNGSIEDLRTAACRLAQGVTNR